MALAKILWWKSAWFLKQNTLINNAFLKKYHTWWWYGWISSLPSSNHFAGLVKTLSTYWSRFLNLKMWSINTEFESDIIIIVAHKSTTAFSRRSAMLGVKSRPSINSSIADYKIRWIFILLQLTTQVKPVLYYSCVRE